MYFSLDINKQTSVIFDLACNSLSFIDAVVVPLCVENHLPNTHFNVLIIIPTEIVCVANRYGVWCKIVWFATNVLHIWAWMRHVISRNSSIAVTVNFLTEQY